MLEDCGVLGYVTTRPAAEINLEDSRYNDLYVTLRYLIQTHGIESVSSILQPVWKNEWKQSTHSSYKIAQEILSSLWIKPMSKNQEYASWCLDSSKTLTQSGFTQTSIFGQIRKNFPKKATDGTVWLALEEGAHVTLRGRKQRRTTCVVLVSDELKPGEARLSQTSLNAVRCR